MVMPILQIGKLGQYMNFVERRKGRIHRWVTP
jgi:hypothetical protein